MCVVCGGRPFLVCVERDRVLFQKNFLSLAKRNDSWVLRSHTSTKEQPQNNDEKEYVYAYIAMCMHVRSNERRQKPTDTTTYTYRCVRVKLSMKQLGEKYEQTIIKCFRGPNKTLLYLKSNNRKNGTKN